MGRGATASAFARPLARIDVAAHHGAVILNEVRTHCASCAVRGLCLPLGLDAATVARLDDLISVRMPIKRKSALYRPGDRFTSLFAIRFAHSRRLFWPKTDESRSPAITLRVK
jgi:hypothetical protein